MPRAVPPEVSTDFTAILRRVAEGTILTEAESVSAFEGIIAGAATPAQLGAFLLALRVRGESIDEVTGAARVLRRHVIPINAPTGTIDTCGTGGDARNGQGSLNVSTAVAFVVAACGVPVAKHGNRAVSSRCGAADVLAALGVNVECEIAVAERALHEIGLCFLLAPRHHPALREIGVVRRELGVRTIFNLLGPLANPAGVRLQVLGVFDSKWVLPIATVLGHLGSHAAWVVHGCDGLDEISISTPSLIAELKQGMVRRFMLDPRDYGMTLAAPQALAGGDAADNATALRDMLKGQKSPYRDIVLLNSAAALVVAGQYADMGAALKRAAEAIDSGTAAARLEALVITCAR